MYPSQLTKITNRYFKLLQALKRPLLTQASLSIFRYHLPCVIDHLEQPPAMFRRALLVPLLAVGL